MARYRIDESDSVVSIQVSSVAAQQDQLLDACEDCQSGRCSCPTTEYEKLASMEVVAAEDGIRIRLEPRAGEKLDTSEIAACLDYTTTKAARAGDDA
jgi:hypothetical protein